MVKLQLTKLSQNTKHLHYYLKKKKKNSLKNDELLEIRILCIHSKMYNFIEILISFVKICLILIFEFNI